jgi:hypothetical protein
LYSDLKLLYASLDFSFVWSKQLLSNFKCLFCLTETELFL